MKKQLWIKEYFTPHEVHSHQIKRYLVSKKTKFQNAVLADTYSFGRCLVLDGEMQSAEMDEFIYHESLAHPAMLLHKNPEDVLIMGGGEGATTREVLRYKNLKKVVTVDIDGEVVDFCIKYLTKWHQGSFTHPKSEILIDDARRFIFDTDKKFDVVLSDLPTPIEGGPAYMLYTLEFYKKLKQKMKPGAIMALEAGAGNILQIKFHTMLFNTLKKIFKHVYTYYAYVPSFDVPWAFILCSDRVAPLRFNTKKIDTMIEQRINGKLGFYDGQAHQGLFNIPKYLREMLNAEKGIISEKKPVYFFK